MTNDDKSARDLEREQTQDTDLGGADLENDDTPFDPEGLDPAMFAQVQQLMGQLEKADEQERELNDLKNRYARLVADFENYRRRTNQDVIEAQSAGVAKAVEALLPAYDDLSRAIEHARQDPGSILGGVESVQSAMLRSFEKLGLTPTGAEGEHFDPAWHEALSVVPGDREGVILQVYQTGFRLGDKLVRPARVVVMKQSN